MTNSAAAAGPAGASSTSAASAESAESLTARRPVVRFMASSPLAPAHRWHGYRSCRPTIKRRASLPSAAAPEVAGLPVLVPGNPEGESVHAGGRPLAGAALVIGHRLMPPKYFTRLRFFPEP